VRELPGTDHEQRVFLQKNWESDIFDVEIESCGVSEDPLGFRAVFFLSDTEKNDKVTFRVGASALAQRARNLALAGYQAPMTQKAICLLEARLKGAEMTGFAA